MVRACQGAGVPLYVAYYRRALPRFEHVRELVQGGSLGAPTMVRLDLAWPAPPGREDAGWRWDPVIAGEGLLLDLGSHALDLLDHWFGEVAEASGFTATRLSWAQVPDQVVGVLRFASDLLGVASWDFAAAAHRDALTVTLERGSVRVPVFADGPITVTDADGSVTERHVPHPQHIQEPLIAAVVDDLLGRGGPCPSTGVTALRTQRVMDWLLSR